MVSTQQSNHHNFKFGTLIALIPFFILIALIMMLCIVQVGTAIGFSMQPTIPYHVLTLASRLDTPEAGDIVVVKGTDIHHGQVKRLIATEGQTISIDSDGNTYVDGKLLEEPYVEYKSHHAMDEIVIPEGYCFVMGDNRSNSLDSRKYGCIPMSDITAVVFYYAPLSSFI